MRSSALLSEIALGFVGAHGFDEQMDWTLRAVGEHLRISRAYLFLDDPGGERTSNTHEWCARGVAPQKENLQGIRYENIPSWRRILSERGRILSTDIGELPEDLRAALEPQGILSIAVYPVFAGNAMAGFVGFDECATRRTWDEDELDLLSTISGIVSAVCERRAGELRLRMSEENYRRLVETVGDLIVVGDPEGRILYANPAVRRKLGYDQEELGRMRILDLHPEDKRDEAAAILGAMFRKERDTCPLELLAKDGTRLPVETRVWFGLWDGKECVFGLSKDLGAEQEALQKFARLFESNPVLMAITGLDDGTIVDVNASFLERLGYSRAEVVGRTSEELGLFVNPVQRRRVGDELARDGRIKGVEMEVRSKDGRILEGLFSGGLVDVQGKGYFLTVMVDITEQIDLRNRVEAQRRRLRNVIEGTRLGTWEWNVRTGETVIDERWAEIVGYAMPELLPASIATWEALAHPDDLAEAKRLLERHFAGETEYYESECRMRHKDGRWVWVLDRGKVVEWTPDGKPLRMFGTHSDITERKEMEERIRELSIRDPLTGIFNRRFVFERLETLAAEGARGQCEFCVAIADFDNFKDLNDRWGHGAGDYVLKEFARLAQESVRPYDILGRYGGEEFIIVSVNADRATAAAVAERIMDRVRATVFKFERAEMRLRFSCGIASSSEFRPGELSIDALISMADERLYSAKERGRDRVVGPD